MTERTKALLEAIKKGETITSIAVRFGITKQAVSKLARRYGIKPIDRGLTRRLRVPRRRCPVCDTPHMNTTYCSPQCRALGSRKDIDGKRPCKACGQLLPLDSFYIVNHKTGQRRAICKHCTDLYNRAWRKRRREEIQMTDDTTHPEPPPDCDHTWTDTATGIACTECGVEYPAGGEPWKATHE